jgi:hypothetical protein
MIGNLRRRFFRFAGLSRRAQGVDRYGVAIKPLAVATIQRLPQRTIESIRPIPGTVSPRTAVRIPSGPSRTAVPPRTSTTVQPSIVVGLVSATGTKGSRAVSGVLAGAAAGALTAGGVCRPDMGAILRVASLLPLDLISGNRREGTSVCAIELKAALFAPHAHPSPKPTIRALATKIMLRFRSPLGFNNANTSSWLGLKKSHGCKLAGLAATWLPTTFPADRCICMIGSLLLPQSSCLELNQILTENQPQLLRLANGGLAD